MSKKRRAAKLKRKSLQVRSMKQAPRAAESELNQAAPNQFRYKHYEFEGMWIDCGIVPVSASISDTGHVTGTAYLNKMEARVLDGLKQAGVLNDPQDDLASIRRLLAGIFLRKKFHEAEIEPRSSGLYDKPLNAMFSSHVPRKSEKAEDSEVVFLKLMKLTFPFNTVLLNVCCLDERPPSLVRHGVRVPCNWQTALRQGLDRVADFVFKESSGQDRKPYRIRVVEYEAMVSEPAE
jgi:hypothetical protein